MHGGKNVKFKQFQFLKNEAIKKLTALEEEPLRLRNRTIEECLSADAVMLAISAMQYTPCMCANA